MLFFAFSTTKGQEPIAPLEQELESIASGNEENALDLVQLAENLALLAEHPLEINFASQPELERLPMLNVFQVSNVLQYRKRTGPIYSPYELLQVKGFDRNLIERLLPYLDFNTQQTLPELKLAQIRKYSRHQVVLRSGIDLERRAGFREPNGFLGPAGNHYFRYTGRYRNFLQASFTAQQDPGEPLGPHQRLGVDFLSGHIALTYYGKLRTLVLGDYQVEFGQGLAFWTGLAFGKTAAAIGVKRYGRGIRPYSGAEENRFMRGAAATYRLGGFDLTAFFSHNRIDARVTEPRDSITFDGVPAVSSLQNTGLHRTENELAGKDANTLQSFGGNLNYKGNGYSIGGSAVWHNLGLPLRSGNALYRKYYLQGGRFGTYSVDFNRLWRNFNVFGELAFNHLGKSAVSLGAESSLADNLLLSLLFRHFDKAYSTLYNAPFAENGQSGEQGLYIGVDWQVWGRMRIRAYADHYAFGWPRFRVNGPSEGRDYLVQWEHSLGSFVKYYIRCKSETQQVNQPEATLPFLMSRKRQNLRFHLAYAVGQGWDLASRAEYAWFDTPLEHQRGFLLFQDVRYTFPSESLSLSTRIALVESPDFDTRIYAYEHDVLYTFSIPAYYGQSMRFYILGSYTLNQHIRLQLRYARSDFFDRSTISSGLNEIEGDTQSEVKLMLRFKL